jgi:cysteinyl-tRNA synthetase
MRMYVCGVTVYDHATWPRSNIHAFDVAQRWLRARGYRVTYAMSTLKQDHQARGEPESCRAGAAVHPIHAEDLVAPGCARLRAADRHVPQMLIIDRWSRTGSRTRPRTATSTAVRQFLATEALRKVAGRTAAGERWWSTAQARPLDFVLWKARSRRAAVASRWGVRPAGISARDGE